ncbi:carbohydrate-binding module family 18 protein [Aaosphaeria arxii CBS 175.79]|uniref:chitinase n=1 Tax=Aaosphaeria arxii CBS 175.79 TaxID=1450172 RepID=A0A6A5XMY9_9PLEO|nr:carbohydrate-binding module family 18 protein [Aaosphaeria arxii CBS 175.79]KAF2014598.1 carbohydrate-binding module family 18 protein [Aaosphaeria arxii CBS 175.79]
MGLLSFALLAPSLLAASVYGRFVIYADEWHPTRPTTPEDRAGIDHVVLAFAMANNTAAFQPKVPISTIRSEYPSAKVMIAVGGWGDTIGFSQAVKTEAGITKFGTDIQTMLQNTGADGVDIDWEYPGGNGADYKQSPNSEKVGEIEAYPKLLQSIRSAIGKDKLLSIAVPGKKIDMIGYTEETGPLIWPSVDYINVMSYDLMNRRDTETAHHTSVKGAAEAVENYLKIGAPADKINLGFAFYAKYFTTQGDCTASPIGCAIVLAEDPVTGADALTSGAWTFERQHMQAFEGADLAVSQDGTCGPEKMTKCASGCCSQYGNCGVSKEHCSGACQHAFGVGCTDNDVAGSWQLAAQNGVTDEEEGGQYFYDKANSLFWTWDTPELITRKFKDIVSTYGLGGVMAWSLGEDSNDWSHIHQISKDLSEVGKSAVDVVLNDGSKPTTGKPEWAGLPAVQKEDDAEEDLEEPEEDLENVTEPEAEPETEEEEVEEEVEEEPELEADIVPVQKPKQPLRPGLGSRPLTVPVQSTSNRPSQNPEWNDVDDSGSWEKDPESDNSFTTDRDDWFEFNEENWGVERVRA